MKKLMFVLCLILIVSKAEGCVEIPIITPHYQYDEAKVAGYKIVSSERCYVGEQLGWNMGMCDPDGHKVSVIFDDIPVSTQSKLHSEDPNHLIIGFMPQNEGIHYFLFQLNDGIVSSKYAFLVKVKKNQPPRIGWLKKLLEWIFD